jgi:hypothetical protein
VEIVAAPAAFQRRVALEKLRSGDRWETLSERCDRTHTAPDGWFYFVGAIAAGAYTLVASVPTSGRWGQQPAPVVAAVGFKF